MSEELYAKAALGQDVQIIVSPKPRSRKRVDLRVIGKSCP
jgi:hypothetical protein